jgi:hypothetical protein
MFVEQIDIVVVCKLLDALDKYCSNTSCEIRWKLQILWMCCAFLSLSNSLVVHQASGRMQCKFKRLLLNAVMITGPSGCVNTEEHNFARVWDKKESVSCGIDGKQPARSSACFAGRPALQLCNEQSVEGDKIWSCHEMCALEEQPPQKHNSLADWLIISYSIPFISQRYAECT